jgi:hypothetical protein
MVYMLQALGKVDKSVLEMVRQKFKLLADGEEKVSVTMFHNVDLEM